MTGNMVIVGGGLAGAKATEALRERGYEGRVTVVGAEAHRPYERPPLSKGYLLGKDDRDSVFVHEETWYRDHQVELLAGTVALRLDARVREVELSDGSRLGYDQLLLATGARTRVLPVPGASARGVLTLRTLDDADRLAETLDRTERLVVVGGGWIGLEVAAAARSKGVAVTVVEAGPLPLLRVLGPEVAQSFAALHRDHGVRLVLDAAVAGIRTEAGTATGVDLADGTHLPADAVLVAVGITPNVELAEDAGLAVADGVTADAALRTSDPAIVAAGDVVNAFHPVLGRQIRVEHWANALHQPAVAAATMLGIPARYERLPYFYTDQYDLGMEYVGHAPPGGYDSVVVRGDLAGRTYVAFWLSGDRVLAGMNVNVWDVGESIRALVRSGRPVDPARLADPDVPLDDV